ncbi:MAG: sulfate adenylyltransferase subunit CysN [Alphaproteobacteria bacterium]|nr:sulfate adenylyltransferase subunit CysN [Alphaproteobacteria bacterium]
MNEAAARPASTTDAAGPGHASPDGEMPILRFLTCGSVDDGKSSLIGRLLFDCQLIHDDTLASLTAESRQFGTTGGKLDLALLVDGLQAEREQGITIDVAYRYFSTPRRKFIVADTPGHEQYTRNMATGASRCDLAIILVDARKGILTQTRRHSCIAHLLGIEHVILAVNKMDLIAFDEERFTEIDNAYRAFADELGIAKVTAIPLSALDGDNISRRSDRMPWYEGPTLLEKLESVDVSSAAAAAPMRMPVQWVCRPDLDFRGYAGTLTSGSVRTGDNVVALPGARSSIVTRIVTADGDLESATAGDAVMLTLADEIDISRGDVICLKNDRAEVADQFSADIVWMSEQPLLKGRPYILRCGQQTTICQISELKHTLNVENLDHIANRKLELNEIGLCNLTVTKPIVFDHYHDNRSTGGFILIDRVTNETVGAGMIRFSLRRAHNVHWQAVDIHKSARSTLKHQRACCLWFTGLSGSGKSTVANLLEKRLYTQGRHTYLLDGDNVRHGLNRDLGFTDADRVENIRRVTEVARLMVDAGLITLVSFISPFRAERRFARERFEGEEFLEIFVDTPLKICESRDAKGLYAKARAGEIKNFTGISSPYEAPDAAEIVLPGGAKSPEDLADDIVAFLIEKQFIDEI